MSSDNRYYEKLYGFCVEDFGFNYATFSDWHYILDKEYVDEGCATIDMSEATITHKFIYPFFYKTIYFIEGVIRGQITLTCSGATATIENYKVSLCKVHEDTTETELVTTGWIDINKDLAWNDTLKTGEELVLPFWIDCWKEIKIVEKERLYLKIDVNGDNELRLLHTNGGQYVDLYVEIPIRG